MGGPHAVLLRPLAWLEARDVRVGGLVWLDLEEQWAGGWAGVESVLPCPEVESCDGGLVTGRFSHDESQVWELEVEGEAGLIGVTAMHPVWSMDRGAWVSACELREGERLEGVDREAKVVGMRWTGRAETVYDIEVDADHCYRVGIQGLLVHNASTALDHCPKCFQAKSKGSSGYQSKFTETANMGGRQYKTVVDIAIPKSAQNVGISHSVPLGIWEAYFLLHERPGDFVMDCSNDVHQQQIKLRLIHRLSVILPVHIDCNPEGKQMFVIHDWGSFRHTFETRVSFGEAVPLPTHSQLDSFEQAAGFQLPSSYRNFILAFGPGELSVSLRISAPGYSYANDSSYDLNVANEGYRLGEADLKRFPLALHPIIKRMFYFGFVDGRDWLAWDTADVSNSVDNEYAIYRVSLRSAVVVASSFKELVETFCEQLFADRSDRYEHEAVTQRVFRVATMELSSDS